MVPASDIFRVSDKRHVGGTVKLWCIKAGGPQVTIIFKVLPELF